MRVSVDMQLSRREIQRLRRLDRKLDELQRVAERHIKGIGDFIGMAMVGIGISVVTLSIISADSIPTEGLGTWMFITLCGLLAGAAGARLLGWMRE